MAKYFIFLAITLASLPIFSGSDTYKEKLTQTLDSLISDDTAVTELAGLQVVLLKQGEVVYAHAKGMAYIDERGKITPLTMQHKVRVASISKFVMTLGIMQLVESKLLNLDTDISDYLGFKLRNPNYPDIPITAKQLLTHTSSIRDAGVYFLAIGENYQDFFRPSKHFTNGNHFAQGAGKQPGNFYTYSNLNFGILAGLIEKITDQRFDRFMEQAIFKPLGLDISFNSCRFRNKHQQYIATLYRRGMGGEIWQPDGPWQAQVDDKQRHCYYGGPLVSSNTTHSLSELNSYQPGTNPTLFSPQGGLRASALDLAKIISLLLKPQDLVNDDNQILSRQSIEQMLTPVWQFDPTINNGNTTGEADSNDPASQNLQRVYGLSTHIINLKDWKLSTKDSLWYGHMAAAYGLLGQMWFNPKTQEGIVILLTGMGEDPSLAKSTTPMAGVEEQLLKIALDALANL